MTTHTMPLSPLHHLEYLALLRTIVETPGDDVPRLVLADWLGEHSRTEACPLCKGTSVRKMVMRSETVSRWCQHCHGTGTVGDGLSERAEFIRVQCELGERLCGHYPLNDYPQGCKACCLRLRERELLYQSTGHHSCRWDEWRIDNVGNWQNLNQYEQLPPPNNTGISFTRGFISTITLPLAAFHAHGREIAACCPLERVVISGKTPITGDGKNSSYRWTWRPTEDSSTEFWQLPRELFLLLPTGADSGCVLIRDAQENWTSSLSVRDYDTKAAALAALGTAAILWARTPEVTP